MMSAQQQQPGWLLSELVQDYVAIEPQQERQISGLSQDSKTIAPGELFIACAGINRHGGEFIGQAVAAGAAAVLFEVTDPACPLPECDVPLIPLAGLSARLGGLASRFYGEPSKALQVIGVTGTNGKTSCSQFIAQAISAEAPCGVIGTLGCGLYGQLQQTTHTTPDVVRVHRLLAEMRDAGASSVVMEVSSHALAQNRVDGVAFDIALFTNLSRDHLDYHGDMASYGIAKRRLLEMPGLKHRVINADDAFGRALLHELGHQSDVTAYSLELRQGMPSVVNWVSASGLQLDRSGMTFTVHSDAGDQPINSPLLGRFNASNLLAAYVVLARLEIPAPEIARRLSQCRPVAGRMECFGGGEQPLVVVDYAHTPDALEQVLLALGEHCEGELWCVFGCGGDRDSGKRVLMGAVAERCADRLVVTDDNPRSEDGGQIIQKILRGMANRDAAEVIRDRAQAIGYAISQAAANDVVLVAGKGHEDYQEVGGQRLLFSDSAVVRQQLAESAA